ncbi:MAG: DUF418 domain-containing protein [Erythrobacter sp.]
MSNEDSANEAGHVSGGGEYDASPVAPAPVAPAKLTERISSLDFIRGLAVMGILFANIIGFGQPMNAYMDPSLFLTPANDPGGWQWITQFVVIDGKMRALFTILFGAGLYLFMERAWARGAGRMLQARRLLILLAIGLLHYFFIWKGDILSSYAVWGLVALACINWKPGMKMFFGVGTYILGGLAYTAMFMGMQTVATMDTGAKAGLAAQQEEMIGYKDVEVADGLVEAAIKQAGDYGGLVAHNFSEHLWDPPLAWLSVSMETWPLILIGMALYQWGFFSGGFDRRKMQLWGWIGLIGGAAGMLAIGLATKAAGFNYFATMTAFIGTSAFPILPMALGMAALLVVYSPGWSGWLSDRVRAAGRAAFTNYLGTSIIMLFVFHGWALDLFGELNRPQLYLVAVLTCGLMLLWSKPWLERFRYGPLEWLWRCLTYGKMFPMKR